MSQFDSTSPLTGDVVGSGLLTQALGGAAPAGVMERPPVAAPAGRDPLALPDGVAPLKLNRSVLSAFSLVHLAALAAVVPWLYSGSGLILAGIGFYVFACLGINVCYHRLLTHRSFTAPRWFERVLTLIAFCNMEGSSLQWVATHRMHHKHSDHQPDPHSPLVNFLWSHMGWMLFHNPAFDGNDGFGRFARDLDRDRFHHSMHHRGWWLWVWAAHALAFLAAGMAYGVSQGQEMLGLQMGLSWFVWGVAVRMVLIWHITWAINSFTHIWGYQSYRSHDDSRNNWFFGLFAWGEGWHNNHHADQQSASNWHRWWEVDIAYLTIRVFSCLGLATNVKTPSRRRNSRHDLAEKRN